MNNLKYNYSLNPTDPSKSREKRLAYEQEVHNLNLITEEIDRLQKLEEGSDLGNFEEGRTDYIEATKTFFANIIDVFNTISQSDTLTVVAVCAAVIGR